MIYKNKLVTSVLSGFHKTQSTVDDVRRVLHDNALNNDEKIEKRYEIISE